MDNRSDDSIVFDEKGFCNYCNYALERRDNTYFPNDVGKIKLASLIDKIKTNSKKKKYDCIMGISGGLDSAYLAFLGYQWGLRILAIHVDDGFNTSTAEINIQNLCKRCNIELIVEQPDKKLLSDIIRAFLRASVPGICNVQDNIIMAYIYRHALKHQIKYFLSGANFSLESILQRGSGVNAADGYHIKAIHNLFGREQINELPLVSLFSIYVKYKYLNNIIRIRPLDLIDYKKDLAISELHSLCGFNYYGGKHYENILTKFAQACYLPQKFNIDKRTSHLSSLIISGQMTREDALRELQKPLYESVTALQKDINYVLSSLNLTNDEFVNIMKIPPKKHSDYPYSILNKFAGQARIFRKYLDS